MNKSDQYQQAVTEIQAGFDDNPALYDLIVTTENRFDVFEQFVSRDTSQNVINALRMQVTHLPIVNTQQLIDHIVDHLKNLKDQLPSRDPNVNAYLQSKMASDRQMFTMLMNQYNHYHVDLYYQINFKQLDQGEINMLTPLKFKDILTLNRY